MVAMKSETQGPLLCELGSFDGGINAAFDSFDIFGGREREEFGARCATGDERHPFLGTHFLSNASFT